MPPSLPPPSLSPPSLPPAERNSAHRTVAMAAAEALRRRILDGEFAGGFQLRQDALAALLQISRIPVREALMQLESEGLVRILPHRGAVVSDLSVADIDELFALRALLEPRLLRRSAARLTATDFAAMEQLLAEYSSAMRTDDPRRWGELNTSFHMLLYGRAGQPRSEAIVATLLQSADRYTRLQLRFTDGRQRAEREHAELLALCRRGAVGEAAALLTRHIRTVGSVLAAFLRTRAPPA